MESEAEEIMPFEEDQTINPGDDVTDLINGTKPKIKAGDDVTALINGTTKPKAEEPKPEPSLWNRFTSKIGEIASSPAAQRLITGDAPGDQEARRQHILDRITDPEQKAKLAANPNLGKLVGGPETEGSIFPKFNPEASPSINTPDKGYWAGFTNSLYNDFVRPLGTPSGFMGAMSPYHAPLNSAKVGEETLAAASKGLPVNPRAVDIGPMEGPANGRRLALPPAPADIANPPKPPSFISAEGGPPTPNVGPMSGPIARGAVVMENARPDVTPPASTADLGALAEQRRQEALRGGQGFNGTVSVGTPPAEPQLPAVNASTRGGINPQTNPAKSLGYPLDIVPNSVRPRTVQSDMLRGVRPEITEPSIAPQPGDITTPPKATVPKPPAMPQANATGPTTPPIGNIETPPTSMPVSQLIKGAPLPPIEQPNAVKATGPVMSARPEIGDIQPPVNPNANSRPFGSTVRGINEAGQKVYDTARESVIKPQAASAEGPVLGASETPPAGKKPGVANPLSNTAPPSGTGEAAVTNAAVQNANKEAGSKDLSRFRVEFGSTDKALRSRPETAPIADAITNAADQKAQWIATTERQLAEHTKGLSKGDLNALGQIIDKGAQVGDNPDLVRRAANIKGILDQIHAELKIPESAGGKMGYIENYLTHINKLPEDDIKSAIKQIWEYHVGKPFQDMFGSGDLQTPQKGSGLGDMFDKGLGNPDSPFRKTRGTPTAPLEMNPNKVLPAYIESIAKLKFDRPAVDAAKDIIKTLPDLNVAGKPSRLKETAQWYVKHYSNYDSMPGLSEGWNDLTRKLMRTTARSMLGGSTGLQTLHLARIPMNLLPELGTKYLMKGMAAVAKNPMAAYREAVSNGLLQNEVRPWAFKTAAQKFDSVSSFMSGADFLDRSIGYNGFKKQMMDQGMNEAEASAKAIAKSKAASLYIDSARPTMGFTRDAKVFGGAAGNLATQFKQVPTRIIEQYLDIASKAKQDPAKAARMLAGLGIAAGGAEAGLHTLHIKPAQFATQMFGATGQVLTSVGKEFAPLMKHVTQSLMSGNVTQALQDTQDWATSEHPLKAAGKAALWAIPGGMSMKRQYDNGLSMFEEGNKPDRKR